MAQRTLEKTQETLKKSAYVAVGIPAHLAGVLRDRWATTRESVDEVRSRLSEEARRAFDEWVEEGERLVSSLGTQIRERREKIEQTVTSTATQAKVAGRGVATSMIEPTVPLSQIDGIGPAYAEKLAKAGIFSIMALLESSRDEEARARLSEQTGIGMRQLESWLAQADLTRIDGLGDEYLALLHAMGVGTFATLAERSPAEMRDEAVVLNEQRDLVDAVPSLATFSKWIQAAGDFIG